LSKTVDVLNVTYDIAQQKSKQNQRYIVTEYLQPCASCSKRELPSSFSLAHPVLKNKKLSTLAKIFCWRVLF